MQRPWKYMFYLPNISEVRRRRKSRIFAIYGTLLIDDEIEEDGEQKDGAEAAMKHLKKRKLLEMPDGTKAEYLTRTFDEAGVEILKKAVEQDIHKFSHIPCMTDERPKNRKTTFGSNCGRDTGRSGETGNCQGNKNRFTRWKKPEIYRRESNSFGRSRHRNIDSVQSNKRKIVKEYSEWKSLN